MEAPLVSRANADAFSAFHAFVNESGLHPQTAVVLGSGLSEVAGSLDVVARAPMDDLLGVSAPGVAGHAREVLVGRWNGHAVVAYRGRYHLYQGLPIRDVVAPILALAGTPVRRLLLTNAAGGLNAAFHVGDLMLVTDHLSLPGLAGAMIGMQTGADAVGFVPMRGAYDADLGRRVLEAGEPLGIVLRQGVYAMVAGPQYETAAELRLLRLAGADAVGMSTVPEVVAARTIGLTVAAISVITNRAVPDEEQAQDHREVLEAGDRAGPMLVAVVGSVLERLT